MTPTEKAIAYIDGVLSGEIKTGEQIKQVCLRHREWLESGKHVFSHEHADQALVPFTFLRRAQGEDGPFDIMPWQAAIVYMAFGWRRKDGRRLTRKVYCKVARGNAKTEFLAAVGCVGYALLGEVDPEVYWVATKKAQAKIGWIRQKTMLQKLAADSSTMKDMLEFWSTSVTIKGTLSRLEYLGKDSDTEDGLTPFMALIDEFHAHKDDGMINVMESGMNKRPEKNRVPMTWIITTAGYNPEGPNSQLLKTCKNILSGATPNDEILPFIFELDPDDDPMDEANWIKANPGMGITVDVESMRSAFQIAKTEGQSKMIDFYVKNLNIEYRSSSGWISDQDWMECPGEGMSVDTTAYTCVGGIDLASTSDFTSLALLYVHRDETKPRVLRVYHWLPEEAFYRHAKDLPVFHEWKEKGWIEVTPGNVMDYDYVRKRILEIAQKNTIHGISYDPYNSKQFVAKLIEEDGLNMHVMPQSIPYLSTPTKEFERLVKLRLIDHCNDPVMRWQIGNVVLYRDNNDNIRINKGATAQKIDGVAASINALAELISFPPKLNKSYWLEEDREPVYL